MYVDRGPKVDMKMVEANTRLMDKNKSLQYDITMLEKKLKDIKKLCETIVETAPQYKPYISRIIFLIEKEENE